MNSNDRIASVRSRRSARLLAILIGCLLLVALTATIVCIKRPSPNTILSAPVLSIRIPDGYYGPVVLMPTDDASARLLKQVVQIDTRGYGVLLDVSIINKGFQLDARRNQGAIIPFIFDDGEIAQMSGDVILFDDGNYPGAALVFRVSKGGKGQ